MIDTDHVREIRSARDAADMSGFRAINEQWITRLFNLTDEDRRLLADPVTAVIAPGGDVLVAENRDGIVVGCVALLNHRDGLFELAKMGVSPEAQGHGVGQELVQAAIRRARELGADRLFLGTNSQLAPAILPYERAGFRRIGRDQLHVTKYYDRADVLMDLDVASASTPGALVESEK